MPPDHPHMPGITESLLLESKLQYLLTSFYLHNCRVRQAQHRKKQLRKGHSSGAEPDLYAERHKPNDMCCLSYSQASQKHYSQTPPHKGLLSRLQTKGKSWQFLLHFTLSPHWQSPHLPVIVSLLDKFVHDLFYLLVTFHLQVFDQGVQPAWPVVGFYNGLMGLHNTCDSCKKAQRQGLYTYPPYKLLGGAAHSKLTERPGAKSLCNALICPMIKMQFL